MTKGSGLSTYFHCLVLDIFRPFLDQSTHLPLVSFEAGQHRHQGDVDVIYRASVNQLKRLVLFYIAKFDAAAHSALWRPALIYALNALIRDARLSSERNQTSEWNFYFRACMLGFSKQLPYFPITDKIVRGILSMAVRDAVMSRAESSNLLEEVRRSTVVDSEAEITSEMDARYGKGSFIVDLDLAAKNPPAATVDVLADQCGSLDMLADVALMETDTEN